MAASQAEARDTGALRRQARWKIEPPASRVAPRAALKHQSTKSKKISNRFLRAMLLQTAALSLLAQFSLLLAAASDNQTEFASRTSPSAQQPIATAAATSSSAAAAAATTTSSATSLAPTSSTPQVSPWPAGSDSSAASTLKRDLSAKLLHQQHHNHYHHSHQQEPPQESAPVASKQKRVCQVSDGESVAIIEIEESRGLDKSQATNPAELPISGSVALGEIELKIESETHKYFRIDDKSLRLTRPLDRDAVFKENSTLIVQQPITSIYLQISCIDKRGQQVAGAPLIAKKVIIPVLVKVLDLNDNAPKFSQPVYTVQVNELAPIGTVVLDQFAFAVDLDSANNGQIEYSLVAPSSGRQRTSTWAAVASHQPANITASSQRLVGRHAEERLPLAEASSTAGLPLATTSAPPTSAGFGGSPQSASSQNQQAASSAATTTSGGLLADSKSSSPTPSSGPESESGAPSLQPTASGSNSTSNGSNSEDEDEEDSETAAAGKTRRRQHQPSFNLNSEPIINGPMEESDEEAEEAEENDEALLAALNASSGNSSTGPTEPEAGESGPYSLFSRRFGGRPLSIKSAVQGNRTKAQGSVSKRLRRSRRHSSTVIPSETATTTTLLASSPGDSDTSLPQARRKQLPMTTVSAFQEAVASSALPWTNLMASDAAGGAQVAANAGGNLGELATSDQQQVPADQQLDSSDFFTLELAPQTNRPVIKLKRQLDFESRRLHQLTLVATDRASNRNERRSSQARILVRVLDGDDQPPAFILDQGGCATGSVPQTTTPIPATSLAGDLATGVGTELAGPLAALGAGHARQAAPARTFKQAAEGEVLTAAVASNLQLRSFRVTDENFDYGDSLGLDDTPIEGDEKQRPGLPAARAWRNVHTVTPAQTALQASRLPPTTTGGSNTAKLVDYLCLSSTDGSRQLPVGGGQQLAEYFATVISGDSDYVLRVAPQSIKARDRDELNAPIRYSFVNGTPADFSKYFQINPLDATIKQVAPIERSQVDELTLFIEAQEQSYNRLFSIAKLTIDVLPTDKSPPVLAPNSYVGFVDENSQVGARVLITSPAQRLRPNGSLQMEAKGLEAVYLQISVLDADSQRSMGGNGANGSPALVASLESASLSEGSQTTGRAFELAELRQTSPPSFASQFPTPSSKHPAKQVQYEFVTTSDAFKVDRDGFVYVNQAPLDRDLPGGQPRHIFQVTARQVGLVSSRSFSSPISLNITLNDLNDNPPQLVNGTGAGGSGLGVGGAPIRMAANSRGGVLAVTKIEAVDRDLPENSQMHFSIQHVSNNGGARFRIDEESGRLEALGKFQAGEQFSLTIRVSDDLERSSSAIFEVQVVPGANTGGPQFVSADVDARGWPAADSDNANNKTSPMGRTALAAAYESYSVEVSEGVALNAAVFQVRAIDPEMDPVTYSIIDGNINGDFSINSKSGVISVANKLDREEISAYKLIVQARDSGGLATSRPVYVSVADLNDQNPVFNQARYVFAVEEGVPAKSQRGAQEPLLLGRVQAQDTDEGDNGRVSYSLATLGGGGGGAPNAGSGTNGVVAGGSPPYALDPSAAATTGGDLKPDEEDEQRTFSIDERTGEVRLLRPLDYEQAKSHTLLVVARDNGDNPRSSSAMVQVRVLDKQDEVPSFERARIECFVEENAANWRVATVVARDPDSVAEVTYVLLAGDQTLFQVDPKTGVVSTGPAGLDFERAKAHSLLVGTKESLAAGALNLAEIARLHNEFTSSEPATAQRLRNASAVSRRTTPKVSDELVASRASLFVRVDVIVSDVNDNAPQFELPNGGQLMPVRVQDTVALGSVLALRLEARDLDDSSPNNQIKYELVTVGDGAGQQAGGDHQSNELATSEQCASLFLVDSTSGQMSVRADLKRATSSECQLVVRARDLAQVNPLSSTIALTVYIDHMAELSSASMLSFADTHYTIELAENTQANTLVKVLPIINKPKEPFPVACEIVAGNEQGRFYVSENKQTRDCELWTRDDQIDFEQRQKYSLRIKLNAFNGGGGASASSSILQRPLLTTQIQVNVLDRNDNRPIFVGPPARYSQLTQNRHLAAIALDAPPETQLIQLRAFDADSAQSNGLVSYELLNEPELEGRFKIDLTGGIVRTSRLVEDVPSSRLPIKLRALARDNPEQTGEALEAVAEVLVNLIDDRHRIALVLKDTAPSRALDNREELLQVLQERTGLISGIERVESLKVQRNSSLTEADLSGTDVWFYLVEPGSLRIVASDDERLRATLFEGRAQNSLADMISENLGFARARVRLPYSLTNPLSNSNGALSAGPLNMLLFGATRGGNSSNDRLAPVLILFALFIAVASAVVVVYQCGSVAGWSESECNQQRSQHQQQSNGGAAQNFAKDKFLFSPPPPPPVQSAAQFQFEACENGSQAPIGKLAQRQQLAALQDQYARSSFNLASEQQVAPCSLSHHLDTLNNNSHNHHNLNHPPLLLDGADQQRQQQARSASMTASAKEYETQMLKMSVLFDDSQSFDEQNLNEFNVNKNLL